MDENCILAFLTYLSIASSSRVSICTLLIRAKVDQHASDLRNCRLEKDVNSSSMPYCLTHYLSLSLINEVNECFTLALNSFSVKK